MVFKISFIWLSLVILDLFIVKDFDHLIINISERYFVNLVLSSLALFTILFLMRNWKRWVIFIILLIPTLIQMTYFEVYKKLVTPFGFKTFLEDGGMVLDLWFDNINLPKSIFVIFLIWWLIGKIQKGYLSKYITVPLTGFLIGVYTLIVFSWYSVPNFQNSIISFYGTIFDTVKEGLYTNFKLERPILKQETRNNLPNIIFIVGESAVLSHSSLYGYERDTTPKLNQLKEEKSLIPFSNVVSIGTKTRLSVPYMLVGLQGIDPHGEIYKYPTIMNYLKSIGYKVIFITSQDLAWGGLKSLLIDKDIDYFVNGTKYNSNARVHKGTDDLIMVQNEILPLIDNSKQPFFLVYQMDGSHYPYSQHSPKEFKKWQENGANSINAYDNTLLYSDEVLSQLIIKMRDKYPSSWVFYSTDHGQNLGGKNGMFNDNFESDVIHNMFFISPPPNYFDKVVKNINSPISQADIVATILDIVDIQPIKQIDGISILKEIPNNRLRVTSTYMPTLHNIPEAVLVFPNLSYIYIDFDKMNATLQDGKNSLRFQDLNQSCRSIFERRL